MTFDDRWRSLATAARRAAHPPGAAPDVAALVRRGLAARAAAPEPSDWRGMALAAGVCAACLAGLLSFAPVRGEVGATLAALAQAPRTLPTTAFIPAPPRPPTLAALSPADLAERVAGWFTASPETTP